MGIYAKTTPKRHRLVFELDTPFSASISVDCYPDRFLDFRKRAWPKIFPHSIVFNSNFTYATIHMQIIFFIISILEEIENRNYKECNLHMDCIDTSLFLRCLKYLYSSKLRQIFLNSLSFLRTTDLST